MRYIETHGYTLIELLFVAGLIAIVSATAIPHIAPALDEFRTAGATRYISTRLQRTRMEALVRSVDVAMQFTPTTNGYAFAVFADGNHNGVLTADIASGADRRLGAVERLGDHFAGVDFGAIPGLPPVDVGGTPPGTDPIRLGPGSVATFSALGTSTSGSVYVRGRTAQYVVRIFGGTGKTRVMKFHPRTKQWRPL
jgi:prepilin-type N-terminal cleavage/methylation domain-containing protein